MYEFKLTNVQTSHGDIVNSKIPCPTSKDISEPVSDTVMQDADGSQELTVLNDLNVPPCSRTRRQRRSSVPTWTTRPTSRSCSCSAYCWSWPCSAPWAPRSGQVGLGPNLLVWSALSEISNQFWEKQKPIPFVYCSSRYHNANNLVETNWCINWVLIRVIDAVRETIADVSSASPSSEQKRGRATIFCPDEGLALETSAIVSLTASITLINTQLIHQFVFRRADAVTDNSSLKSWHYTTWWRIRLVSARVFYQLKGGQGNFAVEKKNADVSSVSPRQSKWLWVVGAQLWVGAELRGNVWSDVTLSCLMALFPWFV